MTAVHNAVAAPGVKSAIRGLIAIDALESLASACQSGPCYTFLLLGQRPGAPTGNHHQVLRQMVRDARTEARPDGIALLEAVEALSEAPEFWSGGPGLAVFRNATTLETYQVAGLTQAERVEGDRFLLLPLLAAALAPQECLILDVNRKHMRLYEYRGGACGELGWPAGLPSGLEEGLALSVTQRPAAENRASTGNSPGSFTSVQFASNIRPGREGAGSHLAHFFATVDSGIAQKYKGRPMLLSGVAEEIAAYRRAAKRCQILEAELTGALSAASHAELATRAKDALTAELFSHGAHALAESQARCTSDVPHLVTAARFGKVHRLWVSETAPWLDAALRERVNACLVDTIFFGGEVFLTRKSALANQPVAGLLRY